MATVQSGDTAGVCAGGAAIDGANGRAWSLNAKILYGHSKTHW
jgi:hypothetical protein